MNKFNFFGEGSKIGAGAVIGNFNTIGENVEIGRECVIGNNCTILSNLPEGTIVGDNVTIDAGVTLGLGNIFDKGCYITGEKTSIGGYNHFRANCVIGQGPKNRTEFDHQGKVRIGNFNQFFQGVVVDRGELDASGEDVTSIGDNCFVMEYCVINHNNVIGDYVILSSKTSTSGHCHIGDYANLGVQTTAHQFCDIDAGVMVGMNATIVDDIPCAAKIIGRRVVGVNDRYLAILFMLNLNNKEEKAEYEECIKPIVLNMLRAVCCSVDKEVALANLQKIWLPSVNRAIFISLRDSYVDFLERDHRGRRIAKWSDK